jgi:hypothetical protein
MLKSNRQKITALISTLLLLLSTPVWASDEVPNQLAKPKNTIQAISHKQVQNIQVRRTPSASRSHAKSEMGKWGWGKGQWACLNALWVHESGWRPDAYNREAVQGLHAGGIPQILGLDPDTSVKIQIKRGFKYIKHRYGNPCQAWSKWKSRADYYDGGWHGGWY